MQVFVLTFVAVALIVAAIALIYMKWLDKGLPVSMQSYAVPLAWGLMAVSAAIWMSAYKPDFGLPIGFLIAMSLPLVLIATRIEWPENAPKMRSAKTSSDSEIAFGPGKALRITARLIACLVLAPLAGLAFALVTQQYLPGHEATRFALAVMAFVVIFSICLIIALSARRPWRAAGVVAGIGILSSIAVAMPLWLQGAAQ